MKSTSRMSGLALLLAIMETVSIAEEVPLPLEIAVKVLPTAAPVAPPSAMPMGARPAPAPTTPAAKYPQYRFGPQAIATDAANPSLRFLLTLPAASVLIEARITIDDRQFAMVRQQRAEQILREVTAGTQTASNIIDRLKHTQAVTGETPTLNEVHGLLSRWIDGPIILPLNSHFQRFRAHQRPEFVILDRNRDGTISAEELSLAIQSLGECDQNQDGMIQFTEIATVAKDSRLHSSETNVSELMVFVPHDGAASGTMPHHLLTNGELDPEAHAALRTRVPDLSLSIAFHTTNPEKSRIALTAIAEAFRPSVDHVGSDPAGITLTVQGTPVILSAVQGQPSDQVSIGAVNDGYPLLPALDPNDDGRLTVRELRGVPATLKTFDRNQDGSLTLDEVRAPIRLCFGLGAIVHRELLGIRSLHRPATTPQTIGPEWFVRMDRNKDQDLTRNEFPGTDDQFQVLDADHDELVSVEEALQFDKQAP